MNIASTVPFSGRAGINGLIKVQKKNSPARPVVSTIGAPEYKLAKFLHFVIIPFTTDRYMLQSLTDFKEKLRQFELKSNQILGSFDINSLFTNVPLDETIHLMATKIYSKTVDEALKPPIKKIFVKLLKIATHVMLMYKEKVLQQIDGPVMGSPSGPTMANFFIANLETRFSQ